MAIAVVFEFPKDSIEKYDKVLELEPRTKDQPARSSHVCYVLPNGGTGVIDVWDSEEAFGKFGEILMPAIEKAGLDTSTQPKIYPVHNTM
jgi:hypothetical protein